MSTQMAGIGIAMFFAWTSAMAQDPQVPPNAPPAARAEVAFAFSRLGVQVPKYRLTIREDGTVLYEGDALPFVNARYSSATPPPQPFRSATDISPATAARVLKLAHDLRRFSITCASKAKNIADTGAKTLSYSGPDGSGSCTYNYSESKDVQQLTDIFQGIAETMDEGRRLDYQHRYDRLGLDETITFLGQEVSEGRALEVATIAASLRSIAGDSEVMERVRTRANALLTLVPGGAVQP
jgi:hypothetical protein